MKKAICTTLGAAQLLGVWFAVAQTNNDSTTKQQQLAIQANNSLVATVSTVTTNPLIAVSPKRLDFGRVTVGSTNYLTFTVQNVGFGTLLGFAITSPPFSIGNAYFSLGSSQGKLLVVRYMPTVKGTNLQSVALEGGGGATVTVSGRADTAPAPPLGLHVVGSGS